MDMEEKNERRLKGNTILLTVIGIATLFAAVLSATFAYFTATVTPSNTTSAVEIETATLAITYNNGSAIAVDGALPDDVIPTKTVTIQNTTAYPALYTLRWSAVNNTFTDPTDLEYSIACSSSGVDTPANLASTQAPATGAPVAITGFSAQTLPAMVTHTCVFTFTFDDDTTDQSDNMGATFDGNFELIADAQ